MTQHSERKHSKFAASGAERWFQCSASVSACEGLPDRETEWSKEGTFAHEVLEKLLLSYINMSAVFLTGVSQEMFRHAKTAAEFIFRLGQQLGAEIMVETRVFLDFIHEAAFGTLDGAILDHFGTLHVFDFKYGAGHAVSPKENLQMIFYALALAYKHHWNFKFVRLWIIQPRIKGYDGPAYWEISIEHLRAYVPKFQEAVWRVENEPTFKEGSWCHWCKAKGTSRCPLTDRANRAIEIFKSNPITKDGENGNQVKAQKGQSQSGQKETRKSATQSDAQRKVVKEKTKSLNGGQKSEADWRRESRERKQRIGNFY